MGKFGEIDSADTISAIADGGLSRGSRVRGHGSEDPIGASGNCFIFSAEKNRMFDFESFNSIIFYYFLGFHLQGMDINLLPLCEKIITHGV